MDGIPATPSVRLVEPIPQGLLSVNKNRRIMIRLLVVALVATVASCARSQETEHWHDPSPHKVQFVTVEEGVQLEVLDWGGSGTPLIFLAGSGDTAHRFDSFSPQFTKQ